MTQKPPFSEATLRQQEASNPTQPVWVSASAGTGKTKVLSDRFLRLLLPVRSDKGETIPFSGTPPEKILCLTFTKAAAAEMENRVRQRLSGWASVSEDELEDDIFELTGTTPDPITIKSARRLFARTVDAPGGMRIMTIHSFCQSVLARFPIEAGITPDFTVLDERSSEDWLTKARKDVMVQLKDDSLLETLIQDMGGYNLENALKDMIGKREKIRRVVTEHGGVANYMKALGGRLGVPSKCLPSQGFRTEAIYETFYEPTNQNSLSDVINVLSTYGTATDKERYLSCLQYALDEKLSPKERFYYYRKGILTKKNTLIDRYNKIFEKNAPHLLPFLEREAERIREALHHIAATKILRMTANLFTIFAHVNEAYATRKRQSSMLDYDDQISLTAHLLEEQKGGWVMYKLDGGFDHILVDEAQDTNPDQWRIIQALTEDMLAGNAIGTNSQPRTIFVVGDEKQSIYSFQNADPKYFARMRQYFHEQFSQLGTAMKDVPMNISFRSTDAVLECVNKVFENPVARQGLTQDMKSNITHIPFRKNQPGCVTLWPSVFQPVNKDQKDLFHVPVTPLETDNAEEALAVAIAKTIQHWLDKKRPLKARQDRPVEPGDILVLVTKRSHFVTPFIKALKNEGIPVAGVDKMKLTTELVIQDLMALTGFLLLPSDDLTLASLLKSPLIGISEDDLFDLAQPRRPDQSLWNRLAQSKKHKEIFQWLEKLSSNAGNMPPFDLLNHVLSAPCPADNRSGRRAFLKRLGDEVTDPLDILLAQALDFEHNHAPSLQEFHHWLTRSEAEIKRELEASGGDAVRVMTVHGAKGLQAPVVILPDTFRTGRSGGNTAELCWLDDCFPCFSNSTTKFHPQIEEENERKKQAEAEEYRRLLYVAMTRAEDELYITGWSKETAPPKEDSWYNLIWDGFKSLAQEKTFNHPAWKDVPITQSKQFLYETKGREQHKEKRSAGLVFEDRLSLEDWALRPPKTEKHPPRPLQPSKPLSKETRVFSPLETGSSHAAFKIGNIVHHLLQVLPDITPGDRESVASRYLAMPAHELPEEEQKTVWQEISCILDHPDFAPLFTPQSRAEVPITGMISSLPVISRSLGDEKSPDTRQGDSSTLTRVRNDAREKHYIVSGQVDRLAVTDSDVLIVDYKTNRPPPQEAQDIPPIYRQQLAGYRAVLQNIYPDKTIRCALLWTHTAHLMELPETMLDEGYKNLVFSRPA